MDEHRPLAPELVAELADRFEERQALDVADRAADLDEHEILAVEIGLDEFLDRVGDVRDHLDRRAEIFAAPLAPDHGRIDAAGGDAVGAARRDAGVALVMAEIEIGLGAVVGDIDLAVLIGAHRPRIDIEIGIELAQPHAEAARLQERPQGRRRKTLAQRGDHAAGDEDEPRHGPSIYRIGLGAHNGKRSVALRWRDSGYFASGALGTGTGAGDEGACDGSGASPGP